MLIRIGDLIEKYSERCNIPNLTVNDVYGIDINKQFFSPTIQIARNTSKYLKVPNAFFACNLMHVGRDGSIPLSYNNLGKDLIVSPAYFVFKNIRKDIILDEYLFLNFARSEFDRYATFCTDSSVRDGLSWDRFCEIEIEIPNIETQQKYVDIYKSLLMNKKVYEDGLADLIFVSNGFVESLKNKYDLEPIGNYIVERKEKNTNGKIKNVRGVSSIEKDFIKPKRGINKNTIHNYNVVHKNDLAYRPVVTGYNDSLCIAISREDKNFVISPIYPVFYVEDLNKLLPEYLFIWLSKDSFDKYAWYHSTGSARETLDFEILSEYKIPIPSLEIQESIVMIHNLFLARKKINDNINELIINIFPILIKGAIQESKGVI